MNQPATFGIVKQCVAAAGPAVSGQASYLVVVAVQLPIFATAMIMNETNQGLSIILDGTPNTREW